MAKNDIDDIIIQHQILLYWMREDEWSEEDDEKVVVETNIKKGVCI